ncbi:MAG: hypothetical protein AB1765_07295 [Candidatus Hydrogenedentota bacterium]
MKDYKKEELQIFGLMLSAILIFVAYLLLKNKNPRLASIFVWTGCILFLISVLFPALLNRPYYYWMKVVLSIGTFVSNVLMIALYYTGIAVTAIYVKLFKKDPLDRKIEKDKKTYWNEIDKIKYDLESMRKQY